MVSMLLTPICLCLMLRALRERFRAQGKVKAANAVDWSATAAVVALPVLTMAGLLVVAPGYLQTMAAGAGGWPIVGAVFVPMAAGLAIKKFIDLKV